MIYITFKGNEYEIPYDRDTLKLNRTIDSTFDNGYFETPPLETLGVLEVSRRVPRGLLVRVLYDEREFLFKTGETHAQQLTYGGVKKYQHRINLVSLTKDLTKKPMENITVTQPKGDLGTYIHSVNRILSPIFLDVTNQTLTPTLTNVVNTNDVKLDGLTIIDLKEYKIALDIALSYVPVALFNNTITINIYYGTDEIYEEKIFIPAKLSLKIIEVLKTYIFNFKPTTSKDLSVKISHTTTVLENHSYAINTLSLSITGQEVLLRPVRTYARVIDKILNRSDYILAPSARQRLNITAAEDKFEENTVYDALNRIGGYVGALIRTGEIIDELGWFITATQTPDIIIESIFDVSPYEYEIGTIAQVGDRIYENRATGRQRREILFQYFDNPKVFDPIGVVETMAQAELDDYVSGVELNTKNVIKPIRYSPFRDGWKSLRNIGGIGQFKTDSIGYETEDLIERPFDVKVKGLASRNASNTVTWTVDDVTTITDRVLEKAQWDTLPSQADYSFSGKQQLLKNNTLYYIKGDNKIYGMSFTGEVPSQLIGAPDVTRALYETILAVRSIEADELITRTGNQTNDDAGLNGDLLIKMQVGYSNQTESRARLYKDDQSGFDTELIKFFNESSNVNESESIGNYAQQIVNRLGGTKIAYEGVVDNLDEIAEVGDVDSQGRVYTIIELSLAKRIRYKYTLVQDYNVISSYIGIQSRHRVEEISSDSNTVRTLRYVSKFIFTDAPQTFITRLANSEDILGSLLAETSDGVSYGYLECYLANSEIKKIHLSVDSDSKGKTIELKWSLPTNYSAGLKRYSVVKGSDTIWLNLDVPYTDPFGKVNEIQFSLYFDNGGTLDTDLYPQATDNDGELLVTTISDIIDKDAREILHGLVEIPILSECSKVRVYNGFARWNKLVEGTDSIRACALDYIPMKNANKIDITRIRDLDVSATVSNGEMEIDFTLGASAKGIAYYNVDTLDILLAYIEDLPSGANQVNLYYKVVDSLFGGGYGFYTQVKSTYKIVETMTFNSQLGVTINENIKYEIDTVLGNSATLTFEFPYQIVATVSPSAHMGVVVSEDIHYKIDTVLGVEIAGVSSSTHRISELVISTGHIGVLVSDNMYYSIGGSYSRVTWVTGGTALVGSPVCETNGDVGNTRVQQVTPPSCSWVNQYTYFAFDDDTSLATCGQDVERTICVKDKLNPDIYVCTVQLGNVTEGSTIYETCTLITKNI